MITITHLITIVLYALALAEYALVESITIALLPCYNRLSAGSAWQLTLYTWFQLTWIQFCFEYHPLFRYQVTWLAYQ
ncbi:hypothetical protein BJX66DRAFT_341625 [Aspergillus keveii]|uniref:Uncharacterized protein n=1 Tax=Aspergillus keveii TaxID=714993 RepID=A0ABR4FUV3_9EURO